MTTIDIVNQLRAQGHIITYTVRKDGGIRVTGINGETFSGRLSAGNRALRTLAGNALSAYREKTLLRQNPTITKARSDALIAEKGVGLARAPRKVVRARPAPLPVDLKKELKRVQGVWRRKARGSALGERPEGRVTTKNLRYVYEHYGREEALARLSRAERYSRKLAYRENVEGLLLRIKQAQNLIRSNLLQRLIDELSAVVDAGAKNFAFDDLERCIEIWYDAERAFNEGLDEEFDADVSEIIEIVRRNR